MYKKEKERPPGVGGCSDVSISLSLIEGKEGMMEGGG